ncbi:MAG TPA: tetratricopeptide repeat protein, partial [Candidatus Sulfopaludibacter sp.]|nr:tetratricopeptide repeat protein [Candidatus Sulfopaludibacter sp.]
MHFSRSRGVAVSVTAAAVFLFAFTTALNSAYRATRQSRAEARYQEGQALFSAGRYEDAAEEFRAALTYVHADSRFALALVRSLMQLGNWAEA